jgi:hypothetical protein
MTNHVKITGWIYIVLGALGVLGALAFGLIMVASGAISGDQEAMFVTSTVGLIIGGVMAVLSLPSIIGGWGVLRYHGWARVVLLILAAISLPGFPVGTALGAYTFWALLNEDANRRFA